MKTQTLNLLNHIPNLRRLFHFRNGIQQRKNSYQDGVIGTTCPIPPGKNFTYIIQVKDQIGSFYYFPSLAFHKAAGAFGAIRVWSRPRIPVPFPSPDGDFWLLAGDWYKTNHYVSTLLISITSKSQERVGLYGCKFDFGSVSRVFGFSGLL